MRYFIALEIPNESKKELMDVQNKLKTLLPGLRITDNNKLHLTIAFIGERPDTIKNNLIQIMQNAAQDIESFEIAPAYIDGFPSLHRANVLWVGIKGDIDKLQILRERIKDGLISLGLDADERRYIPHIAIAKSTKLLVNRSQERALQEMMLQKFAPMKVSSIRLFESLPDHGFHTHNTLSEIQLKQEANLTPPLLTKLEPCS